MSDPGSRAQPACAMHRDRLFKNFDRRNFMLLPDAKRTWIVMLHSSNLSVFESDSPGGCITRMNVFPHAAAEDSESASAADIEQIASVARWLEQARTSGRFEKLMLVGSAERMDRFLERVSEATRALLSATRIDDLNGVPPEDLRWHMPDGVGL